jgi:hypothetical protein
MEWITLSLAILGTITGVVGTALGIWSFKRDTPSVVVSVLWDAKKHPPSDSDESWGVLRIENTGRRSVFVSHAHIRVGKSEKVYVIPETISGYKISEGDKPIIIPLSQQGLELFSNDWETVCIVVEGTGGKKYTSNFPEKRPSWAN